MLGSASDELKKIESCNNQTRTLRERFERDFDLWRNEPFSIPKTEGKWESFTTNRPSTDANKLINTLATARLKLWIPLTDETEKERKHLSKTERFPYGVIALRDSIAQTIPEALPLQAAMSWFAPMRGWEAILCYLFEQEGKVIPHIAVWDLLNTYWISGNNGLLWAAYKRYATKEELQTQYETAKELSPDKQGRIEVYDIWDSDEEGVVAGGDYLKKEKHNCKHIPVLILPGGSTPLIQSGKHDDTIKNVGESVYVNNRDLFDIESRMGSYCLTISGRVAKTPMAHEWDSTRGGVYPGLEGSPFEKGTEIPIDVGKGEKLVSLTPPELTRDFFAFWEYLQGRLSVGGQAPVSFGQINQALPAAGINLLRHASMDNIKPPQQLMERTYVWLAHELVSQYKNGDFEKMEIQGQDGSNRRFKMEVKPSDIDDSWNFEANLIADLPQDEMANIGMAVQATQAELLSLQTARDKYGLADDTDQEQKNIDREKAYSVAGIQMRRVAAALQADGDTEGAQYILDAIQQMQAQQKPGVASQPGIPSPMRPSADTSAVVPRPPGQGMMNRFLSRLGGGRQ